MSPKDCINYPHKLGAAWRGITYRLRCKIVWRCSPRAHDRHHYAPSLNPSTSIDPFLCPEIHGQLSRVHWLRTVFTGNRAWAEEGDSGEAAPVGEGPRSGRPALASSSSDSTCTEPEL